MNCSSLRYCTLILTPSPSHLWHTKKIYGARAPRRRPTERTIIFYMFYFVVFRFYHFSVWSELCAGGLTDWPNWLDRPNQVEWPNRMNQRNWETRAADQADSTDQAQRLDDIPPMRPKHRFRSGRSVGSASQVSRVSRTERFSPAPSTDMKLKSRNKEQQTGKKSSMNEENWSKMSK